VPGPAKAKLGPPDSTATANHHGMTVDATADLDLSYTPPLGSPWDAVQLARRRLGIGSLHPCLIG